MGSDGDAKGQKRNQMLKSIEARQSRMNSIVAAAGRRTTEEICRLGP